MKRALILSGGGSLGAFEVGAIDYLIDKEGFDFDIFLGTSVGALNASFLGQALNADELRYYSRELKSFWLNITGDRMIYDRSILGEFILLFRDYLYKPTGLTRIIEQKIDFKKLCGNPAKIVKITAVALETGDIIYVDNQTPEYWPDFPKYILASTSMPLFFPGVWINSQRWYDGGLRDITPLGTVFDEHPDEVVIITTYPLQDDLSPCFPNHKPVGSIKILLRTIDILAGEIGANDLKLANFTKKWPEYSKQGQQTATIRLIFPETPLPATNSLDFNPKNILDNIQRGYIAAQKPRILKYQPVSQLVQATPV